MKKKIDEVTFSKRKLENIQYEINAIIAKYTGSELCNKLAEVFEVTKATKEDDKSHEGESDGEGNIVKEELLRQRNWLSTKLKSMNKSGLLKKLDSQKKQIQEDNLKLIRDCNLLREDNTKVTKRVQMLEKKFKEI